MFEVKVDCEYGDSIRQFFQGQFPSQAVKSEGDTLELVMDAIIASGKIRLGPKPNIESLFSIRQHLSAQIASGEPIRFLMPWGSEKPGDLQTVDLAEVAALKTLDCLQERVTRVYTPGIQIRMRVEDGTAPNLFDSDRPKARLNAQVYSDSLENLIVVLGMDDWLESVRETRLVTEDDFEADFFKVYPTMMKYLLDSENWPTPELLEAYNDLKKLGWAGTIPKEQREHYRAIYRRLYGYGDAQATSMLGRYLSQSLSRKRLNMLGNLDWNDYLGLSFVGPVPGEPKGRTGKRIYYRTLPENVSSLHMAPWRAKGYFSISNDDTRAKLASWADTHGLVENSVTLTSSRRSVTVRCDYRVS